MPRKRPSRPSPAPLALCAWGMATCALAWGGYLATSPAALNSICVTVTVIGEEDVPLDATPCEGMDDIRESSSSAASSEPASSSASSAPANSSASSSGAGTGGGVVSTSDGDGTVTDDHIGGYRGSPDGQMERTRALLENWREERLRSAAPRICDEPYRDVQPSDWFAGAVRRFYCKGYLEETRSFHPPKGATRAEFAVLIVKMSGWKPGPEAVRSSFDDMSSLASYAPYIEEAARRGWVMGYENCYRVQSPCFLKPDQIINRAEAAAMMVRFFSLKGTGGSAAFVDVPETAWYFKPIQIAADHCIFQGDDGRRTMRPGQQLNRAEMVTILDRLSRELETGLLCSIPAAESRGPAGLGLVKAGQPPSEYFINGSILLSEGCDMPSFGCLTLSVVRDTRQLLASLFSFPLPDGQSLSDLSTGEPVAWALFVLALSAGGAGCSLVVLHRLQRYVVAFSRFRDNFRD